MFKRHSARLQLHLVSSLLLFFDRYIKRFESKNKRKKEKRKGERFGSRFAHNEETAVLVHQAYFSMGRGRDTLLEAAIRAKSWKGSVLSKTIGRIIVSRRGSLVTRWWTDIRGSNLDIHRVIRQDKGIHCERSDRHRGGQLEGKDEGRRNMLESIILSIIN